MRLHLSAVAATIPLTIDFSTKSASFAFHQPWMGRIYNYRVPSQERLVSNRLYSTELPQKTGASSSSSANRDAHLLERFTATECDDVNTPPSLASLLSSMRDLKSGSDIRGQFVDHARVGSIVNACHSIRLRDAGYPAALTPLAAFFLGHAFADYVAGSMRRSRSSSSSSSGMGASGSGSEDVSGVRLCIGRDPRVHGVTLADAFSRGAESVNGVSVLYTGLATTPSMFEFCRADKCDGAVMVSASHLPEDRNGLKFFTKAGGLTGADIDTLIDGASDYARHWYNIGLLPPSSGIGAVDCSKHVDFMPHYAQTLKEAIVNEVCDGLPECDIISNPRPLEGLRVVLNAGNGAGYFFNDVLEDLGADVSHSVYLNPDGTFPAGVPNPEKTSMIDETTYLCEECRADIGVMLDTDADRAGFVLPRTVHPDSSSLSSSNYEALNRNRLIALLSVIFSKSSPGCTIVTDSVTSEGLADFLETNLGLTHVRYLKGYANVIGKARELTESGVANAEMAIETSGHCAMKENDYLDDGTYTAVKVIGLLARVKRSGDSGRQGGRSLLDLISDLDEMGEVSELRMSVRDGTLGTMWSIFDRMKLKVEDACAYHDHPVPEWKLDEANLEGVRVKTGGGGFFMLRMSLHDPVISLQVEATGRDDAREKVVFPLLDLFEDDLDIADAVDFTSLQKYGRGE